MTDRLSEIRARLEKATPGRWDKTHIFQGEDIISQGDGEIPAHVCTTFSGEYDADFIAHARTDLEWAIAEIERLQTECVGHVTNFHNIHNDLNVMELRDIAHREYIARLEARLRESLSKEAWAVINSDKHVDAEMAELRDE